MSTLEERKVEKTFPVGKVVRAFRTMGEMKWELGKIKEYDKSSKDGSILGVLVKFFSDGVVIDYPIDVLTLGEESFVVDVPKEDVIRELWPVGVLVMIKLAVDHEWHVGSITRHHKYGIGIESTIGNTSLKYDSFSDDAKHPSLMRYKRKR